MKKALAIILVVIVCMAILPVSVFAAESIPQPCSESVAQLESDSYTAEDAYQDFVYRITHFSLNSFSDFIFWLVIAIIAIIAIIIIIIVVIIIAIIGFIVFGIILEVILLPLLTALAGPIGAAGSQIITLIGSAGGAILSAVGVLGGIVIAFVEIVLPYLPQILDFVIKISN